MSNSVALLIVGPAALVTVIAIVNRLRGTSLRHRFAYLGPLKGKRLEEITREVGPPNARTVMPDGTELIQWIRPSYHISLVFTSDICQGVQHELSA